jgi:hypothetical protein
MTGYVRTLLSTVPGYLQGRLCFWEHDTVLSVNAALLLCASVHSVLCCDTLHTVPSQQTHCRVGSTWVQPLKIPPLVS